MDSFAVGFRHIVAAAATVTAALTIKHLVDASCV
jgi:hypothetical protein